MNMLEQQELIEPAPARRVIVPPGCVNHWGVDPSTKRLAIGTLTPDRLFGHELLFFSELSDMERLVDIYDRTFEASRELAMIVPPGHITLERMTAPKDRPLNPELQSAASVGYTAVVNGVLAARRGLGLGRRMVSTDLVSPGTWKKASCGRGNLYKPKKMKGQPAPRPEEYKVLQWAWENGLSRSVVSWDVADAVGMAEAGRRNVMLEER